MPENPLRPMPSAAPAPLPAQRTFQERATGPVPGSSLKKTCAASNFCPAELPFGVPPWAAWLQTKQCHLRAAAEMASTGIDFWQGQRPPRRHLEDC